MTRSPLWRMVNEISWICAQPCWCGGIHKDQLAQMMGVYPHRGKMFEQALMVAYRQRRIQFCWSYVCPGSENPGVW